MCSFFLSTSVFFNPEFAAVPNSPLSLYSSFFLSINRTVFHPSTDIENGMFNSFSFPSEQHELMHMGSVVTDISHVYGMIRILVLHLGVS